MQTPRYLHLPITDLERQVLEPLFRDRIYDYLSRLVSRELPASSITLHLVHDPDGNVIAEYDSTGTLITEYVWIEDRPLAVIADAGTMTAKTYRVQTDHLERPFLMTDDAASTVWQASYLPFGEAASVTGTATLDYCFPGQWFQLESGLHYNWHRHYDATTGRYLQPDPLGMPDGPSRWAYVLNSPLMYVDPQGLVKWTVGPPGGSSPWAMCGRCKLIKDRDRFKGEHTHWECPGQPRGCIRKDGQLCDGSAPPPPHVEQCLREGGRISASSMNYGALGACIAAGAALACVLAPEVCLPVIVLGGRALAAQ